MLTPKTVHYKRLQLDPNNPRLAKGFGSSEYVGDEQVAKYQSNLEKLFGIPPGRESQQELDKLIEDDSEFTEDDFYSIKELKDSMRRIGFVGIQNLIVREINNSGEYLVIEGNRRVASIKAVLREHEKAHPGMAAHIDDAGKLASLKEIEVMVLQTDGRSPDEIEKLISTTLALRHYGSLLKWDLLPRAKNIYDEYIKKAPEPFEYTAGNGKHVAEVMAIKTTEMKKLLRGYISYKQLSEMYPVKPHHFSLILAAIENSHLNTHKYFDVAEKTFQLLGDTAEKLDQLCEFEERDMPEFGKIINEPKEFKKLGLILKDSKRNQSESIRNYAQGLFDEVVQKEIPLDNSYTDLVGFKKRHKWVQEIQKFLEKQQHDENLNPKNFINLGQELKLRDDLRKLLKKFIAIMEM